MKDDPIKPWLLKSVNDSIQFNMLVGIGAVILGVAMVFVAFFMAYAITAIFSETLRVIFSLLAVGFLFLGDKILSPAPLARPGNSIAGIEVKAGKAPAKDSADSVQTFIRMATTIAFCGPKTIYFGLDMIKKAKRMKTMDFDGCVAVLTVLLHSKTRVPYSEIKTRIPKLDTLSVFAQMEDIHGVLFLDSDPPGLSLSEDLRRELSIFMR